MRDILVDLLVECHDAADGAHRDVWSCQQAPDAELPGIGVSLLEMVHRQKFRVCFREASLAMLCESSIN